MADAPPPPPNQAQEDATTLLREVEERRQSMNNGEPPEIAAMRRLLAQFTPTEPEIDESELLPRDLGDMDDTNEFADAFWERATKEKMVWGKWPGSLWAACAKHERSVLSLKVLNQRVTVEFEAERSRVLLARSPLARSGMWFLPGGRRECRPGENFAVGELLRAPPGFGAAPVAEHPIRPWDSSQN